MRSLVACVSAFTVLSCARAARPETRIAELDSTQAVNLALDALQSIGASMDSVVVREFLRDSAGVIITFRPSDPLTRGGGAQVRVSGSGTTKVLYIEQ